MPDRFDTTADLSFGPARRATAITPHDSNALTDVPKAIYVGTSGHIALRAVDSAADVTLKNVPVGYLHVRASHIRATGTTATDLVALG